MLDDSPNTLPSNTLTETALNRLRGAILGGALAPEEKLRLRALSERFGIGATPLREALSRLAAEGLVLSEGQRGFSVPPITREHLLDITRSRQITEAEALRQAMALGDAAWEDEIVASFHLLKRQLERREATEAWLDAYEARHHRFHRALIAACPLNALKGFCEALYGQTTRYRRVLTGAGLLTRSVDAHHVLMEKVLARAPDAPAELAAHIGTTAEAVLAVLASAAKDGAAAPTAL
ncbi:GntR family transcriptional regulator [Rhodovarius lipocyclicus]|uniref:GntR family transcriptional regulator n=1 Tax=Rhodovarius lipocyclicus TaxID=268410 RepID=UPI00135676F6|nr:GntR family transcriptional regulator [Rhodovarius lipocyclicus]